MVDRCSRVKCHCVGFQFPSELWNVWKTPSSRCCDTWYWPRKLWFGCGSACIQKVITVSYTLCLSRSLPDQTFTPQGVIDTHWAHLCSSTHNHCSMCMCVCLYGSSLPLQSGEWENHTHSSDGAETWNANTKEMSTHQSNGQTHKRPVTSRWEWICARLTGDGEGIIAEWPIILYTAASQTAGRLARDELYSPFLSRSYSPAGSSISISHSLSSCLQHKHSLNQSNYQPQNGPQTHLPVC